MEKNYKKDALIFKALADEKRLTILSLLQDGEKCACVLIEKMNMGQSALSYHMKILCESKIVHARQDGKWIHYSLSEQGVYDATQRLMCITKQDGHDIKECCQ